MVIPKRHVSSYLFGQEDEAVSGLVLAAKRVAILQDEALDGVARTGIIFDGYGVDHLHAKLFPMHRIGSSSEFGPISSSIDKYFERY